MTIEPDFRNFLEALIRRDVRFVLVGAFAVIHQGFVRTTGDMDVWIYPDPKNAEKVIFALDDFGFGALGISKMDLTKDNIVQLGRPPVRIDILTSISGVSTDEIWRTKTLGTLEGLKVYFLGRETLFKNKKAAGRIKDLADLEGLCALPKKTKTKRSRPRKNESPSASPKPRS